MQGLLTDIELDIQELRYLTEAFLREPNAMLREVLKRNILQMRGRLDSMLQQLDVVEPVQEKRPIVKESIAKEPVVKEEVAVAVVPVEAPVIEAPIAEALTVEAPVIEARIVETPVAEEKVIEEPIVEEPLDKDCVEPTPILAERIRTGADLRRSISLNDSFRFSRELFGHDPELMNRVLQQIGEMSSYQAAVSFLTSKVHVEEENEAMNDLLELLKKYFN
ncbi:hypothetical protein [Bacteroides sp.]|uniref:hypothetical protein n=2 Tax=Bacteroides sp. TaxID=29523 RepID=UPI002FCB9E18